MPFLHRPGCDLYYEVTGAGPAVVFAHGLGGNHLSWWQQVPHLAERYTCITFSHRGFGPSREDPGGPGPAAFVDDLGALLDRLGIGDVRLVAQSMGGWTCLGYALHAPERVRRLVMASTFGSLADPELDALLMARQPRSWGDQTSGVHAAAGERMGREQPALHFLYREIEALNAVDRATVLSGLIALRTTPPAALAALAMPVLCVVGDEDVVIPPDSVAILASRIPGARLVRVPAAGHSVYFERAETFNRLLDEFLSEDGRR